MNISRLNLSRLKNVKSSGLIKLATSPYVQNIKSIDISFTEINDAGIMAIANSSYFISLIDINFKCTPKISPAAIV